MKVLNLYSSIGGNRKLWYDVEVTAIEKEPARADFYKSQFPEDNVIITDAHEYLLKNYKNFDFIRASPPCPTHSDIRRCGVDAGQYEALYPDMKLYQEIILLKHFAPKETKRVVENVIPYYDLLIPAQKLERHLFWSNFFIPQYTGNSEAIVSNVKGSDTVFGFNITNTNIKDKRKTLRDMVDPQLGLHIFEASKTERQQSLFFK